MNGFEITVTVFLVFYGGISLFYALLLKEIQDQVEHEGLQRATADTITRNEVVHVKEELIVLINKEADERLTMDRTNKEHAEQVWRKDEERITGIQYDLYDIEEYLKRLRICIVEETEMNDARMRQKTENKIRLLGGVVDNPVLKAPRLRQSRIEAPF